MGSNTIVEEPTNDFDLMAEKKPTFSTVKSQTKNAYSLIESSLTLSNIKIMLEILDKFILFNILHKVITNLSLQNIIPKTLPTLAVYIQSLILTEIVTATPDK